MSQSTLDKVLLQKRAIRLTNVSPKCEHAIPFFVNLNILPVRFLSVESVSCLMYDVQNKLARSSSFSKFIYLSQIHIRIIPDQQPPTNFYVMCLLVLNN